MEIVKPKTKEDWLRLRTQHITSTEVSALFGCCPYKTPYQLWHEKLSKQIPEVRDNERMEIGREVEGAIARVAAKREGWDIEPIEEYMYRESPPIGSSFDYAIGNDGLLECKNVDGMVFNDQWTEDASGVHAPPHIELQVQHQLLVSERSYAYLAVLVGGNRIITTRREPDPSVASEIIDRVSDFWRSISVGTEPDPDLEADAEFLRGKFQVIPKTVMEGTTEIDMLVAEYKLARDAEKAIGSAIKVARSKLIMLIGEVSKVKGDIYTISAAQVAEKRIEAYTRESYRNFRVTFKKGAK